MNHAWKYGGDPERSVSRSCRLCGAAGGRLEKDGVFTRWETQLAPPDGPWASGRVPRCPAGRKKAYVPVSTKLAMRLEVQGIVPLNADVTLEHQPGDWRRLPTPENPSWTGKWADDDGERVIFSCHSMRRCAEAAELHLEDGQVIPEGGSR